MNYEERSKVVSSIKGVQSVMFRPEPDYRPNLLELKPDYVIHGDDWSQQLRDQVLQTIDKWGGKLIELRYTEGISSTRVHNKLRELAGLSDDMSAYNTYAASKITNPLIHNKYKRVVLKLSGKQLSGAQEFGIDPIIARYLAAEIQKIVELGCEIVIIIGGGNLIRGAKVAGNGIRRVTADQMGMISGLMNAMALTDIFESEGLQSRCVSNIYAEQIAESYSYRLAEKHLKNKYVLLVAGGSGRPYVTHDTVAVMIALELDCEIVLKSAKISAKHNAMTFQQAVEGATIKIMDKAALGLAMEQNKPVMIFDVMQPDNLLKVIQGESVGTLVGGQF